MIMVGLSLRLVFSIQNGEMVIPNRPGLGVELNMKVVEEHRATKVTDFVLFKQGWENRNMQP